jgi:DNA-binding PadR family transcriptional regulator
MTSAVNWALLGLVISRSSYGFELSQRFERTYGEVLRVSGDSHVYHALSQLEARGLVEVIPGAEIVRQPKLHYRATPLGVSSYQDWLVEQVDVESRRQELWVRQLAVFAHDPQTALAVIERIERQYQKRAGQTGGPPGLAGTVTGPRDERGEVVDGLVAQQRRLAVGGMLSWLRHAHARFEALAGSVVSDEPPRT